MRCLSLGLNDMKKEKQFFSSDCLLQKPLNEFMIRVQNSNSPEI